jgi:hypothetical protein
MGWLATGWLWFSSQARVASLSLPRNYVRGVRVVLDVG